MLIKKKTYLYRLPLNAAVVLSRQKRFYSKLIYRAICDIVNYRYAEDPELVEAHRSANEWMFCGVSVEDCEDEELYERLKEFDDAMSFETACFMLKWDPDWVRERVPKLTKKDLEHIGRNGLI